MFPLTPFRKQSRGRCQKEPFYFQAPVRAVWESPGPKDHLGKRLCALYGLAADCGRGWTDGGSRKGLQVEGAVGTKAWEPRPPHHQQPAPPRSLCGQSPCQEKCFTGSVPFSFPICYRKHKLPSILVTDGETALHRLRDSLKVTQPRAEIQIKVPEPVLLVVTLGCLPGWPLWGQGLVRGAGGHGEAGQGQEEDRRPARQSPLTQGLSGAPPKHFFSLVLTAWLPVPTMSLVKLQTRFPVAQNQAMSSGISLGRGRLEGLSSQHQDAAFTEVPMATWKYLWLSADSLLGESSRGGITASRAGRRLFELLVLRR